MYTAGKSPTSLRQISTAAFSGKVPQSSGGVVFEPFAINGIMTYANPDDHAEVALAQGGLFDFSSAQTVRINEIRAAAALGNISVIVGDRLDLQTMGLTVGGATPAIDLVALGVVRGDKVVISAVGTETYTVVQVNSAAELQTEEFIIDRALVAGDSFSITNYDGTVVRYSHTLVGTDTLDAEASTLHDVPVGTPAPSRVGFANNHLTILSSQVIRVTTASADPGGWLDIYVVKAGWI